MSSETLKVLSKQLEDNFLQHRQTEEQKAGKLELRRYLLDILNPFYYLFVVGSSVNELASKESDADICLIFTDRCDKMDQSLVAVSLLNRVRMLISRDPRFQHIDLIPARVPLLKFKDVITNVFVDLNVHNIVGIRNTRLLKAYSDCDSRFPKLVLAVKRWAKGNNINNAHQRTLSSYSLTLLVVHYLQVCKPKPVLPCLQVAEIGKFGTHDDYSRYTLNEKLTSFQSQNSDNLGQLFLGFLKYFAHEFDYVKSAISIRLGRVINKEVAAVYPSPVNSKDQWTFMGIEEPFSRSNVAVAIQDVVSFEKILFMFRRSYDILQNGQGQFKDVCSLEREWMMA